MPSRLAVTPRCVPGPTSCARVGASFVSTDVQEGSVNTSVSKTGWGVPAGLGYDLRVGRNVSITPCVNYFYGQPGDVSVQGRRPSADGSRT